MQRRPLFPLIIAVSRPYSSTEHTANADEPYILYNSGTIEEGVIVENKRLSHALQVLQEAWHTANRYCGRLLRPPIGADGAKVARSKIVSSRRPCRSGDMRMSG